MFLLDWLKKVLGAFGLYQKNAKILFLGLDNAGKTALLRRLKDDRMFSYDSTICVCSSRNSSACRKSPF